MENPNEEHKVNCKNSCENLSFQEKSQVLKISEQMIDSPRANQSQISANSQNLSRKNSNDSGAANESPNKLQKLKSSEKALIRCSECSKNEMKHLVFKCFTCKKEKCEKCANKDCLMFSQKLRGASFLCAECFSNQSKLRTREDLSYKPLQNLNFSNRRNRRKRPNSNSAKKEKEKEKEREVSACILDYDSLLLEFTSPQIRMNRSPKKKANHENNLNCSDENSNSQTNKTISVSVNVTENLLKKKRRSSKRRLYTNKPRRKKPIGVSTDKFVDKIEKESKDSRNMIITIPFSQKQKASNLKTQNSESNKNKNKSAADIDKMNIVKFDDFILYEQICSESEDESEKSSKQDQNEDQDFSKHNLLSSERAGKTLSTEKVDKPFQIKKDQNLSLINGQSDEYNRSLINYVENFYFRKNKSSIVHKKCAVCKFSNFNPKKLLRFKSPNDLVDYIKLCLLTREFLCTNKDNFEQNKKEILTFNAKYDIDNLVLPSMSSDLNTCSSKKYFLKSKNICKNCFRNLLNNPKALDMIRRIIKNQNACISKKIVVNIDNEIEPCADSIAAEPSVESKQVKEIKFFPTNSNNQSLSNINELNDSTLHLNNYFLNSENPNTNTNNISTNLNIQQNASNNSNIPPILNSDNLLDNNISMNSGFQTNPLINNLINLSNLSNMNNMNNMNNLNSLNNLNNLNNMNNLTNLNQINNLSSNILASNNSLNNLNLLSLINGYGGAGNNPINNLNLNLNQNAMNSVNSANNLNSIYNNLTLRLVAQNLMIKNQIMGLLNSNGSSNQQLQSQQLQNLQQNFQIVSETQNFPQSLPIQPIQPIVPVQPIQNDLPHQQNSPNKDILQYIESATQNIPQAQPTQFNQSTFSIINNVNNINISQGKENQNVFNFQQTDIEMQEDQAVKPNDQEPNKFQDPETDQELEPRSESVLNNNSYKSIPLLITNSKSNNSAQANIDTDKKNIFDKILLKKKCENSTSENLFDKLMVDTFSKEAVQSHLIKNNIIFEKIINGRDYVSRESKNAYESNDAPDAGLFFVNTGKDEKIEEGLRSGMIKNNQNDLEAQVIKNNLMAFHETNLENFEKFKNFEEGGAEIPESVSNVISDLKDISNFLTTLSCNQSDNGPIESIESGEPSWNVTKKILSDLNKKIYEVVLYKLEKVKDHENKIRNNIMQCNQNVSLLSGRLNSLNTNIDILSNLVSTEMLDKSRVSQVLGEIKETSNSCGNLLDQIKESCDSI